MADAQSQNSARFGTEMTTMPIEILVININNVNKVK